MEEDLEPGLAWMVIATEDGGIDRIQDGKLWLGGFTEEEDDWVGPAELDLELAFAPLPFLAGGILYSTVFVFGSEQKIKVTNTYRLQN